MDACLTDRELFFGKLEVGERVALEQHLSWEEKGETVSLLFQNRLGEYYTLPGLAGPLSVQAGIEIEDKRPPSRRERIDFPKDILPSSGWFQGLLDFQAAACAKCISKKRGIVRIPTGGGKSEVELSVCRYLKNTGKAQRGIIIVPSINLAGEIEERALSRGFSRGEVGVVHGSSKQFGRWLTVAVADSINRGIQNGRKEVLELVQGAGFIIFDEAHTLRANKFLNIAFTGMDTEYLLGFSATPFSEDSILESLGDSLVAGITGGVIFDIPSEYLVQAGLNAESVILFKKLPGKNTYWPTRYDKLYNTYIVENTLRNEIICKSVRKAAKWGFPVLVSVVRHEHARILMEMLKDLKIVSVFGAGKGLVVGSTGEIEPAGIDGKVFTKNFEEGVWDVAIASSVMDVGLNIPSIGLYVIAGGMKARIKTVQRRGRGVRAKRKGPNRVYIIDFMDRAHVYLSSQSKKRRKLYEDEGSVIIDDDFELWNLMHDHKLELEKLGREASDNVDVQG